MSSCQDSCRGQQEEHGCVVVKGEQEDPWMEKFVLYLDLYLDGSNVNTLDMTLFYCRQDVTTGVNLVKEVVDLFVLFLKTACESTIFQK